MEKLMLPFQVSASVFIHPPARRHNLLCAPSIFWTYMTKQQQDVVVGRCRLFCVSVVCGHRLLPSLTPLMFLSSSMHEDRNQVFVANERTDSLSCWNPHRTKIRKQNVGMFSVRSRYLHEAQGQHWHLLFQKVLFFPPQRRRWRFFHSQTPSVHIVQRHSNLFQEQRCKKVLT